MSAARLERLHERLAADGLDGLIVAGAANLRYLTGCADFFRRGITDVGQFTLVK